VSKRLFAAKQKIENSNPKTAHVIFFISLSLTNVLKF